MACDEAHPVEVYAIAEVCWCEARGEDVEGQVAIVDAIRNRASWKNEGLWNATRRRMCNRGRIDPKLVELVAVVLREPVSHPYRHWLNPATATDMDWLKYALTRNGKMVGRHLFFN